MPFDLTTPLLTESLPIEAQVLRQLFANIILFLRVSKRTGASDVQTDFQSEIMSLIIFISLFLFVKLCSGTIECNCKFL
jgi:hypothetical protein